MAPVTRFSHHLFIFLLSPRSVMNALKDYWACCSGLSTGCDPSQPLKKKGRRDTLASLVVLSLRSQPFNLISIPVSSAISCLRFLWASPPVQWAFLTKTTRVPGSPHPRHSFVPFPLKITHLIYTLIREHGLPEETQ